MGTTSAINITTNAKDLATIDIPYPGIWYIEYQFSPNGLGGSSYVMLSVSATLNAHDSGRIITKCISTGGYSHSAGYMIVVIAAATYHFVANIGTGGSASSTSSFMRATRIS